ncbi:P-loop NTPase fold protein [Allorhizocola rhizosphaerae]|uniref:P-loop NTPase fold protein n=1 Tax=Allorhizocola rhizosphaerae TaxID=1872709 RepID=UPI000E3EC6C3|nr:P-loop NTPase fold protein [Allorhizocola rhizosphaerae]
MAFLHVDKQLVLAIGRSQGVDLLDAATEVQLGVLAEDTPVSALAALPNREHGDLLLVGGPEGLVWVWDPRTHGSEPPLTCGTGEVRDFAVGIGPDGGEIVLIARQTGVCVWQPGTTTFTELSPPDVEVGALPFKVSVYRHRGRHYAACALTNGVVATWDLADPDVPPVFSPVHNGPIWSMITVPGRLGTPGMPDADGGPASIDLLATGGSDQMLRILLPDDDGTLKSIRAYGTGATIRRLGHVVADNTSMIATASARGPVTLWRYDGTTSTGSVEVTQHKGEVYALACEVIDDFVVIASGDFNGQHRITRMTARVLGESRVAARIDGTIWAVAAGTTVDGDFYACAGVTRAVHVVDPIAERDIHRLIGHQSTVRAIAFAGDATDPHLISCGADHGVIDWEPATGRARPLRMDHTAEIWAVATVEHGGKWHVITGGPDGTVRRCALGGQESYEIIARDCGEVHSLTTIAADDQIYVVIGSTQGLLRVPLSGGAVHPVTSTPINAVAVTPDTRHLVVAARSDGQVELYDVVTATLVRRLDMPLSNRQVRALACHQTESGFVVIFGGCDNGDVLKWGLDGRLVGDAAKGGTTSIRAMTIAHRRQGKRQTSVLLTGGHDGELRAWVVAPEKPLSTGGELDAPVRASAILLNDQPSSEDQLARETLAETVVDALSSTAPPIVVGIHAPWGHGKSSLLEMIRAKVDPEAARVDDAKKTGQASEFEPTHVLFHGDTDKPVTDTIKPSWAWARLHQRMTESTFPYAMRPKDPEKKIISVWFNPWMYERPEQIWAGLAHEILTGVTRRLPTEQRRMLYFDLNLKRTGAAAMRKQIMMSLSPRTMRGLVAVTAGLLTLVAAVVAVVVGVVNTGELDKILGTAGVIAIAALFAVGRTLWTAVKGFSNWYDPAAVQGPVSGGVVGLLDGSNDPLETPERGYLYLLRHDLREVIELATRHSTLYIFIDDMDRCSPSVVSDTIEAINLFLTNAFGPAVFVMGLDPATVAAHLESEFSSIGDRAIADPVSFGHLKHTGWRFMEKIIDLPVRLPRLPDVAIVNYLEYLLLADQRRAAVSVNAPAQPPVTAVPAQRNPAADSVVASPVRNGGWFRRSRRRAATVHNGQSPNDDAALAAEPSMSSGLESLALVRSSLHEAVKNLPARNPRQVKTFVNLWRFYMVLEYKLGVTTTSLTQTQQHSAEMARVVEIMVRWPWLLDMLGKRYLLGDEPSIVLDWFYTCARDSDEVWNETVKSFQMAPDDAETVALRELLRRPGGDRQQLIAIAKRYL